jgi:hypothetical protein
MHVETAASIAMLAGFIWAVRFLIPKAIRTRDPLAITCAVLTAALALFGWLLIGVRV